MTNEPPEDVSKEELWNRLRRLEKAVFPNRREMLKATAGIGALGAAGLAGRVSATPGDDGDTVWGSDSNRDDYYVDEMVANLISADGYQTGSPGKYLFVDDPTTWSNANAGLSFPSNANDIHFFLDQSVTTEFEATGSMKFVIEGGIDEDVTYMAQHEDTGDSWSWGMRPAEDDNWKLSYTRLSEDALEALADGRFDPHYGMARGDGVSVPSNTQTVIETPNVDSPLTYQVVLGMSDGSSARFMDTVLTHGGGATTVNSESGPFSSPTRSYDSARPLELTLSNTNETYTVKTIPFSF